MKNLISVSVSVFMCELDFKWFVLYILEEKPSLYSDADVSEIICKNID